MYGNQHSCHDSWTFFLLKHGVFKQRCGQLAQQVHFSFLRCMVGGVPDFSNLAFSRK